MAPDVVLRLQESGVVSITHADGAPLSRAELKLLRDQKGGDVEAWLKRAVSDLNADYHKCVDLHLETPSPSTQSGLVEPAFAVPRPRGPTPRRVGLVDSLLFRARAIHQGNLDNEQAYQQELEEWEGQAQRHEELLRSASLILEAAADGQLKAMEYVLSQRLQKLPWPRETSVSFEFNAGGETLDVDVDLPEIEDMPARIASVSGRGIAVTFKERKESQVRRDYVRLVNGTIFRVLGEAFAALPTLQLITASGFTQRQDSATGHEIEDYVISVRAARADWAGMDFSRLGAIDPRAALGHFEAVQSPDRTGRLRPIEPLNAVQVRGPAQPN